MKVVGKFTSVSGMHSKMSTNRFILICLLIAISCQLSAISRAELIDGVVAFVDESAITLSEFKETYEKTRKINPDISKKEVLNSMINKILLLTEAKKLKIEARNDEELLNEYIDLKVKAFIKIREEDLEDFYNKNTSEFKGASYETVRDKIEEYLAEREVNRLLKMHIDELRSKAYVKIVMD